MRDFYDINLQIIVQKFFFDFSSDIPQEKEIFIPDARKNHDAVVVFIAIIAIWMKNHEIYLPAGNPVPRADAQNVPAFSYTTNIICTDHRFFYGKICIHIAGATVMVMMVASKQIIQSPDAFAFEKADGIIVASEPASIKRYVVEGCLMKMKAHHWNQENELPTACRRFCLSRNRKPRLNDQQAYMFLLEDAKQQQQ